jgi:hypothetical protein
LKKIATILLAFCVFNLNAQKAFFGSQNNEPARVVQSALAPFIISNGLVVNLDANYSNSYSGTGAIWYDIAGSNNGTITGGTFVNAGGVSFFNFLNLNVASYVSVSHTKTASMTFSVWAKSNSVPVPNSMLFNAGVSGSGPDFFIVGTNFLWNTWDAYNTPYKDNNNVDLNHNLIVTNINWHNYTVVVDAVANNTKFYFDGVFKGTSNYWTPLRSSATAFYLGGAGAGDNSWNFIGGISVFHSYNRVLSANEVATNFNALKSRFGL